MPTNNNLVNDDAGGRAVSGANQGSGVVATPNTVTSAANAGTAKGITASPGPSGAAKNAQSQPGRRMYNPLAQLASYTYNFTLYMMTPDAYDAFVGSGRKKIDALAAASGNESGAGQGRGGAFVVAQSGGVNNSTQNRAPGFELDYYIDNVKFTTTTTGKDTGVPAFTDRMTFTITEPYGFSFMTNLKRAREALAEYSSQTTYKENVNAFKQFFIMGIRFYGYDANGNLINGNSVLNGQAIDPAGGTEALFERFYDLDIQDIKFNVNGKTCQYTVTAVNPNSQTMMGIKRGRIATGFKGRGRTVHEMLMGPDGLFTKLNKEQQDKVKKNPQDQMFANEFDVVYLDDAYDRIGVARMALASDLNKWRWPGSPAVTSVESTDAISVTATPDNTSREIVFNNDTSIVQAITQIIQKSTYMENALKTIYNNVTQPNPAQKGLEQTEKSNPATLAWFTISTEISNPKWDPIIADWAYKITYIVQVYEVPCIASPYSNASAQYYGPHKRFAYFLTGQNSEVLDFSLNFNLGYQNIALSQPSTNQATAGQSNAAPTTAATAGGQVPVQVGVRQNADSTGSLSTSAEAQNQIATQLTSPEAYTDAKIKILGDPDFLMRDQASSLSEVYNKFYGSDGYTVSAHGGQVFVEVELKESQDYKHSLGLQQINEEIVFMKYPPSVKKIAKGIIFYVRQVVSTFSNGRFEQELTLNMADSFSDLTGNKAAAEEAAARNAAENELQEVTVTGKRSTGGSVGNSKATVGNTGQRTDPPVPKPEVTSPANSPKNNNTVGTNTPQLIGTRNGATANDDSLQPVVIKSQKKNTEGRELIVTTPDLLPPGEISYPGPPVINLGRGRG